MPKQLLRRYLPTAESLRENPALRPLGDWLRNPQIWHLHRRAVAGAAFIGCFCAFLPVPFQMLVAAVLAVLFRVNLPIAVVLVWMTNPITITPMFYFAFKLGAWLLGTQESLPAIEWTLDWWRSHIDDVAYPLLFGSLVCGWVAGVSAYVLAHTLWRFHVIRRWRERRERRRTTKKHSASQPSAVSESD